MDVVTGAFGFTGRYIAGRLLAEGRRVRTLTAARRPERDPLGGAVEAAPFRWDDADALARSLDGAEVLYNAYWIRVPLAGDTAETALAHTRRLFDAARRAGVGRVVHVSLANADERSPLPYYRDKALAERALAESGLSHAILRPPAIFGIDDVLVNNVAWSLRRFPVFGVFGRGDYRIRPIHVADIADLAVAEGARGENATLDAVGPEAPTYLEFVRGVARAVGKRRLVVPMPALAAWSATWCIGRALGDVVLSLDEMRALTGGLLSTESPATGETRLSEWLAENGALLGRRYARERTRAHTRDATARKA